MVEYSSNNKRIARNTLFMYFRMFFILLVGLYTSRVVLNTLGVSDYGIYNVMGGVIGMLMYVNTLLSGGTSRFLNIEIGRGDRNNLKLVFKLANTLSLLAVVLILLLGETVGLWFMNNKLNIDPNRMNAANWVYQCALFSCCLSVIQTPYTAAIIAHEKMDIYAYLSVFDVTLKLAIVFVLRWIDFDKLKLYSCLVLLSNLLVVLLYQIVSVKLFEECRLKYAYDKTKFREMISYSGWNMVGAFADILNNYGLNILLNVFFGTIVNAARGIALQVSSVLRQFYSGFQTASRPQIMKYYAKGELIEMSTLINNTSKYSSFLLLCVVIPVAFNIRGLLQLWLGQVPQYTDYFVWVLLAQVFYQAIDFPIGMGIHAVGKMKLPNISSALLYLSVFPITYLAFKLGAGPVIGYCIYIIFSPLILIVDLLILRKYSGFSIRVFIVNVILPVGLVSCLGFLFSAIICFSLPDAGTIWVLIKTVLSAVSTACVIFFIGLSRQTREKIMIIIKKRLV